MKQMLLASEKPRDCTANDFQRLRVIKRIMEKDLDSFVQVMKWIQS